MLRKSCRATCHDSVHVKSGCSNARVFSIIENSEEPVLTVLSAEPVARTYSLKGLKPKQFTSAECASTESTTPVESVYNFQ